MHFHLYQAINLYKTRIVQQRRIETYQNLEARKDVHVQIWLASFHKMFQENIRKWFQYDLFLSFYYFTNIVLETNDSARTKYHKKSTQYFSEQAVLRPHPSCRKEYGFVQPKIHPCVGHQQNGGRLWPFMDTLARIGVLDDMKNHEIQDPLVEIFSMSGLYKGESPRPKTAENKESSTLQLADDKVYDPATGKLVRLDAWELRDGGTQRCRTGCPFSLSEWCKDGSSATLSHWTNESLKKKVWNMSYVCEFVVVSMFHVILIPIQNDSWFSAGPWILLGSTIWGWNARLFGWVKRDLQFVPWTRDNRGTYWWFNACDFGVHARQRTECLDVGMKCGTLKTPSIIGRESQKRCVWQQMIMQLKSCMKNGNDAFLQGTASRILMMRTCFTIMMTETSEICRFWGRIARSLFVPNLFDIYLASLRPFPFAGYMFAFMKDYRGRSQQQVFKSIDFLDLKKGHKKPCSWCGVVASNKWIRWYLWILPYT